MLNINMTAHQTSTSQLAFGLLKLARLKQWIKNSFVLAPLLFASKFTDPLALIHAMLATVLFCIASSATYILNDYHDIEQDKKHPKKATERPLASGLIQKQQALMTLFSLYAILLFASFFYAKVMLIIAAYLLLNIAYSLSLKHQPVLDIFSIAFGFVLRIYAGACAIAVPVSSWMFVTTLSLAVYLATIKRAQELTHLGPTEGRTVLKFYTPKMLERFADMSATGTLLFYSLFVVTAHPNMVITVPLVLFGFFRYWYLTESTDVSESPTDTLYSDKQLLITVLLWVGCCLWRLWI